MEVVELWTSHVIHRLADALYNFFGLRLTKEQTENEHPLDFVSRTLKENGYLMDEESMGVLWLGLDIWLRVVPEHSRSDGAAGTQAPGPLRLAPVIIDGAVPEAPGTSLRQLGR